MPQTWTVKTSRKTFIAPKNDPRALEVAVKEAFDHPLNSRAEKEAKLLLDPSREPQDVRLN